MKAADMVAGLAEIGTTVKCFEVLEDQITAFEKEIPGTIRLVRNTMKIHQITTTEKLNIRSRILSCTACENLNCTCFSPDETQFTADEATAHATDSSDASTTLESCPAVETLAQLDISTNAVPVEKVNKSLLKPVDNIDESLIGQYCMVSYVYDGLPFPGIILSVDEDEVEVKTMSRIGHNRWFWPMRDDILWYSRNTIITLLSEEPVLFTKRHHKINDDVWAEIEGVLL